MLFLFVVMLGIDFFNSCISTWSSLLVTVSIPLCYLLSGALSPHVPDLLFVLSRLWCLMLVAWMSDALIPIPLTSKISIYPAFDSLPSSSAVVAVAKWWLLVCSRLDWRLSKGYFGRAWTAHRYGEAFLNLFLISQSFDASCKSDCAYLSHSPDLICLVLLWLRITGPYMFILDLLSAYRWDEETLCFH